MSKPPDKTVDLLRFGVFLIKIIQVVSESYFEPDYFEEDYSNLEDTSQLWPSKSERIEVETGLEFLEHDYISLDMNIGFFFRQDPYARDERASLPALVLVQMFIRNIKGWPMDKIEYSNPIESGKVDQNHTKPNWCYEPYKLKELVEVELQIYNILQEFYLEQANPGPFPGLESYLADIEESSLKAIRYIKPEASESTDDHHLYIASHPLLIYRMIRRFEEDLQPILDELKSHTELIDLIHSHANPNLLVFPTSEDLVDALDALSRTQHGHHLNTYKMGNGILDNVDTGMHLNALHCLELGAYYLQDRDYDFAIQWFHFALERIQQSAFLGEYPEIEGFFDEMLELGIEQHNLNFETYSVYLWNPGVFNTTVESPFNPLSYTRRINQLKPMASQAMRIPEWNWALKANFRRLCSGEKLQTEREIAELKCWYTQNEHEYWLINPLKTELLKLEPPVFQIYDVIGDKLIENIKTVTTSHLERSGVVDVLYPGNVKFEDSRTSTQTWLTDDENGDYLQPLTRSLELLSGLKIRHPMASDDYQVASYGPSHHYDAHLDSFEDPDSITAKGNRITTIMGYLSNVQVGGRTSFPVLGIAAEPIKGSIVIWDNLKRNGWQREERSWHGGCPVVLGIKWITNKWVYYNENMLTFQCGLHPDD